MSNNQEPIFEITAKYYANGKMDISGFPTDMEMAQNCVFGFMRVLWNYFVNLATESREEKRIITPDLIPRVFRGN